MKKTKKTATKPVKPRKKKPDKATVANSANNTAPQGWMDPHSGYSYDPMGRNC